MNRFLVLSLLFFLGKPAGWAEPVPTAAAPSSPRVELGATAPEAAADWVRWDPATDRVVSAPEHHSAGYPRAQRLSNGDLLLGYHYGVSLGAYGEFVALRKSRDDGATWAWTRTIEGPEGERFWGFSNVSFVELGAGTGRLLLVTAARGRALPDVEDIFRSECQRSELRLRFSSDYGETWGAPRSVAAGIGRVWEPSLVRLPSGELQLFYANEAAELATPDGLAQRIELIRSHDDGQTWSSPVTVSDAYGTRPGMPAAVVLPGGNEVLCAHEVVHNPHSPWITPIRRGQAAGGKYLAQTRRGFGSAPFLLGAPDGGMFLAIHSPYGKAPAPDDAPLAWIFENIWVQRGDANGRNFGAGKQPWPHLDRSVGAFFPALLLKDERTLVALATFVTPTADGSYQTVVRWIEGHLKEATPAAMATTGPAPGTPVRAVP